MLDPRVADLRDRSRRDRSAPPPPTSSAPSFASNLGDLSFAVALPPPPARPSPAPSWVTLTVLAAADQLDEALGLLGDVGARVVSRPDPQHLRTGVVTLIVAIPVDRLDELAPRPPILRVDLPAPIELSDAPGVVAAAPPEREPRADIAPTVGLDGAGVLVGVIDTGVDWRHPDFTAEVGGRTATRIERLVHARTRDGISDPDAFPRFSAAQIDEARAGGCPAPPIDPVGHGTACASVAAGSGAASGGRYRGVAPGASLFVVHNEGLLDVHVIEGIREAFEVAGDRPCVVNLSLGTHFGAHDGTSPLENEIANLSGPGRIVVCAGGNDGSLGSHAVADCSTGPVCIGFRVVARRQAMELWVPRGDDVECSVVDPEGNEWVPDVGRFPAHRGTVEVSFSRYLLNHDDRLQVTIRTPHPDDEVWYLKVSPTNVLDGTVHAWGWGAGGGAAPVFVDHVEESGSLRMPATEERCVAVAAHADRGAVDTNTGGALSAGQVADLSSRGPTRIGVMKPDISAPGVGITVARPCDAEAGVAGLDPSGLYTTQSGTSIATPFVTGVVALLLQHNPRLGPEQVHQLLRITSVRTGAIGKVWNVGAGWGLIDPVALVAMLRGGDVS